MNKKLLKTVAAMTTVLAVGAALAACGGDDEKPVGEIKYAVTYSLNGGEGTLPTETDKAAGEKFKLAAADGLTKDDYTFDGWSDGTNKYAAGAEYEMPAHSVTFTAQWKENDGGEPSVKFKVNYSLNGGVGTLPTETDKAEGEKFNLASSDGLSKENYTFDGWSDGTNKYAAGAEYTMSAQDVTFTAQWAAIEYTVTYRAGVGADGTPPAGGRYKVGEDVSLPQPTGLIKDGYVFNGWKDDESNIVYQINEKYTMPAHEVSFTAQWKVDTSQVDPSVKYTVTVEKSSNSSQIPLITGNIPTIEDKSAGETFKIPADTFSFAHYTLTAWRVQKYNDGVWETLNNYAPDGYIEMPECNVRVVGVWTANDVTISFNANGGSGEKASITKKYNSNMAFSTSAFDCTFIAPQGKMFQGWATSPNGYVLDNGTKLDSTIVSAEDTLTLYAIWTAGTSATINDVIGNWSNGTDYLEITGDNLGNKYAQGSGILNGKYLVYVYFGKDSYISDFNGDIYYGLSYDGSAVTLVSYDGTDNITLTSKTVSTDSAVTEFTGKWSGNNNQPWIITPNKAYYNQSLREADIKIIGSTCVLYYNVADSYYMFLLKKNGGKLTGYYSVAEKAPQSVEFNEGTFIVLTVDGTPNQIVSNGSAPDATKIKIPTAPEGKVFSKWVIAGTQTEFNAASVITADVSIEAVFENAGNTSVYTYTGSFKLNSYTVTKIVLDTENKKITMTYLNMFNKEVVATYDVTTGEYGYFSTSPTGDDLWLVVSEDGNSLSVYDNWNDSPDELFGTLTRS